MELDEEMEDRVEESEEQDVPDPRGGWFESGVYTFRCLGGVNDFEVIVLPKSVWFGERGESISNNFRVWRTENNNEF